MSAQKRTPEQLAKRAASLRKHRKLHPEKWKEWRRIDYEKHKDKYIASELKSRLKNDYGITITDYNRLLAQQIGLCAICKQPERTGNARGEIKRLAIDHDHKTGLVRGLLCAHCNQALGHMDDSVDRLRSAAFYIERNNVG